MTTNEAPPPSRRRLARVAPVVLGATAWLAALAVVGFVSSRTDPIIGESAQNLAFTYVLLAPAFVWLGVHLRRRRDEAGPDAVDATLGRRRFLVEGMGFAGATVIGSVAARPVLFAAADPQTPTSMITDQHGTADGPRVLVTYESQYGSTAEVADMIGRTLGGIGRHVDVRHVDDVDTVAGYDLVVVGGAIQYDRWMPGAADFVRAHRRQLATTPVAFFFTCLAMSTPGTDATRSADQYEEKIRAIAPEIVPLDVGRFAGVLDYSRMTPVTRVFARVLMRLRGADAGDHRDWSQIRTWATGLTSLRTDV